MKKKKLVIIIVLLALLLLVAGFLIIQRKNKSVGDNSNKAVSGNLFTSVKDALSKNLTLSCEFNDSNSTFKSYIKNGAVRFTTSEGSDDQAGEMLMKNDKMYVWDSKTKQGFVYNVPQSEEGNNTSNSDLIKTESYFEMIDKYKDSCKVASLDDTYFVVPTDVKFEDMSKLFDDLQKQMPQIELPNQ